jgi:hypothetical protein
LSIQVATKNAHRIERVKPDSGLLPTNQSAEAKEVGAVSSSCSSRGLLV